MARNENKLALQAKDFKEKKVFRHTQTEMFVHNSHISWPRDYLSSLCLPVYQLFNH